MSCSLPFVVCIIFIFKKGPTDAFQSMNAILLHGNQRHVSVTRVTILIKIQFVITVFVLFFFCNWPFGR